MVRISHSCPSAKVVQACERHGIDWPLQVDELVPFHLLTLVVFDRSVWHVVKDWQFDLFEDAGDEALVVGWKCCWLVLIQAEATDFIELTSEPCDGFLAFAEFDCQSMCLGWVHWFIRSGHGLV